MTYHVDSETEKQRNKRLRDDAENNNIVANGDSSN